MKNTALMALAIFAVVVVSNGSAVTSETNIGMDTASIITSVTSYLIKMFMTGAGIVV
ncbi:MAG: hypothetical protein HYT73_03950 [Candidatus Aenigmarchaeota archaeon]|nr:hypothetical protein [Candidatus Aenigmarchaeota archaeon]